MNFRVKPAMQAKVAKILDEIRGVEGQSVNSFEATFLRDMRDRRISFGTDRQNALVDKIGVKVFGETAWQNYANGDISGVFATQRPPMVP